MEGSTKQYIRDVKLLIGDDHEAIDVSQLRIRFAVKRGDIQTPNKLNARVYNLAPNTENKIREEFTRVRLEAGYKANRGLIFDGTVIQVRQGKETATDTYLDITAADGDEAYNYSVTAISLAAGHTSPRAQAEVLIRDMARHGVQAGYIPETLSTNNLPRGKVIYGQTRDAMRRLSHNTDTSWSIQDGEVDMIPLTSFKPSGDIPVISANTGMIGMPEQTANGIAVRVLLNPRLKIGQLVKIDNKTALEMEYSLNTMAQKNLDFQINGSKFAADGLYYIMNADHIGDTRGNAWYTDLMCLAADATLLPPAWVDRIATPGQQYIDETKARIDTLKTPPNVVPKNP